MVAISLESAQTEAAARARNIFTLYNELNAIVIGHEATIQKRCIKRTEQKRGLALMRVLPELCPYHHADFKDLLEVIPQEENSEDIYLWLHINLEDLLKVRHLLLFIKFRGRHPPRLFVPVDANIGKVERPNDVVVAPYLPRHTMLLHNQSTSTSYGRIYSWVSDDEAMDWFRCGYGKTSGEGLLILKIQETTLEFLFKCCKELLPDLSHDQLVGEASPVQHEPTIDVGISSTYPSLAILHAELPYRLPEALDFENLISLIDARAGLAHDHIHALREDPWYFETTVMQWMDHRPKHILDKAERTQVTLRMPSKNHQFWNDVLQSMAYDAYYQWVSWRRLCTQIDLVQSLLQSQQTEPDPTKKLPHALLEAICCLLKLVDTLREHSQTYLEQSWRASRHLRKYQVRDADTAELISKRPLLQGTSSESFKYFHKMIVNVSREGHVGFGGVSPMCDEIHYHIEGPAGSQACRAKITQLIASFLGDLSLFGEIERVVHLLEPWAPMFVTETGTGLDQAEETFHKLNQLQTAFNGMQLGEANFIEANKESRFGYPSEKRVNVDNLRKMIAAEENLDRFWKKLDAHLERRGRSLTGPTGGDAFEGRALIRTNDWTPQLPFLSSPWKVPDEEFLAAATTRLNLHERDTRPFKQGGKLCNGRAMPANREKKPQITVSKRAHKVFGTLFSSPDPKSQPPNDLAWPDFLNGMDSVSFTNYLHNPFLQEALLEWHIVIARLCHTNRYLIGRLFDTEDLRKLLAVRTAGHAT